MAKSFREWKEAKSQEAPDQRLHEIQNMIAQTCEDMALMPDKKRKERVCGTLRLYRHHDLATKIEHCAVGKLCGSLYCIDCRKRAATSLKKRLFSYCKKAFDDDEKLALNRLRHATILCQLVPLHTKSVKAAVTKTRKNLTALKRRFPDIWMKGAFEFEVVDLHRATSRKAKTLSEMKTVDDQYQILVHFHALMDVRSDDAKTITNWMKQKWPQSHAVLLKGTIAGQSLPDKCEKIASYSFKDRVKFNNSFKTDGYLEGNFFTYKLLSDLIVIYDSIGSKGYSSLLIDIGK